MALFWRTSENTHLGDRLREMAIWGWRAIDSECYDS
jgi:hypothetical protein